MTIHKLSKEALTQTTYSVIYAAQLLYIPCAAHMLNFFQIPQLSELVLHKCPVTILSKFK